jgi:hypothetical protein
VTPVTPLAFGGPQVTDAEAALEFARTDTGAPGTPTIAEAGLDGAEAPDVVEATTLTSYTAPSTSAGIRHAVVFEVHLRVARPAPVAVATKVILPEEDSVQATESERFPDTSDTAAGGAGSEAPGPFA